jgi:hypothetical protein
MPSQDTSPERTEMVRRIAQAIADDFGPYSHQLEESFDRLRRLVALSLRTGDHSQAEEILRSAVVLNHAYLEDFLRTLANRLLPERDEGALKDVPLAGVSSRGRVQFSLADLVRHRHKSVDSVIRESVSEYLERSTFNNTTDIAQLLGRLCLDLRRLNRTFPALEQMIRRRHQIVHRADEVKTPDSDTYRLQPIALSEVRAWLETTHNFIVEVVSTIAAGSVIEVLEASRDSTPPQGT